MSPTLQFLKLVFAKLGLGISLLFRYWKIGFTLIFVALILVHSILLAAQTHSFQPIIDEVGVRFVRIDQHLYNQVTDFNQGGKVIPSGFFAKLDFYLMFFADIWMIYIYMWCIWWVLGSDSSPVSSNADHNRNNWIKVIVIFMIIQTIAGLFVYYNTDQTVTGSSSLDRVSKFWHEINPIKGVWEFLKILPYLINPTIENSGLLNTNMTT